MEQENAGAPGSSATQAAAPPQAVTVDYDDRIVKMFLGAVILWGVVGMLVGVIIALQIAWWPAFALAVGFTAGGFVGARLAMLGGERLIRIAMAVAVVALAGQMLGLYRLR